jgi:[acyl-carrier-protein] S-malonyltransferase
LALTENTQPALLLVSTATFRVIEHELGVTIGAAAGHSVGEYAAVVAGGSLAFTDALRAVRVRGRAMQKAVPVGKGAMAAVMGLTDEQVTRVCAWVRESTSEALEPANFNAPGQVVISGTSTAMAWLKENSTKLGDAFPEGAPRLKLIPLSVSAPFHCSLMKPAEEEMRLVLKDTPFNDSRFRNSGRQHFAGPSREAGVWRGSLDTMRGKIARFGHDKFD